MVLFGLILREGIPSLLPVSQLHHDGRNVGKANILELPGRQRGSTAAGTLHWPDSVDQYVAQVRKTPAARSCPLLVMFVGLFVVVGGLEKVAITPDVSAAIGRQHLDNSVILAGVTAVLSNVVSNVPAVLLLKSFVPNLQDPQRAWLVVAMAATLAGNFTLVGSVANLIVAQRAKAKGVEFDFGRISRWGHPSRS